MAQYNPNTYVSPEIYEQNLTEFQEWLKNFNKQQTVQQTQPLQPQNNSDPYYERYVRKELNMSNDNNNDKMNEYIKYGALFALGLITSHIIIKK